MERTKAKQLAGSSLVAVTLLMTMLYAANVIGTDTFLISLVIVVALCFGSLKYLKAEKELAETFKRHYLKKKVPRTTEGTLFEAAAAMILVGSIVIGFATHTFEYRRSILDDYMFFFILAIASLVLAYRPLFLGLGNGFASPVTNDEQFRLCTRQHRVFAIIFALMAMTISASPTENPLQTIVFIGLTIAFFVTWALFLFLHSKNK